LPACTLTGSDDGLVQMSKGRRQDLDEPHRETAGLPGGGGVSEVVPSKYDANTVYVTVDAHRLQRLQDVHLGFERRREHVPLAQRQSLDRSRQDDDRGSEERRRAAILGTETGIFLSIDRGKSWRRLKGDNFPTVRVDEITIHPRDNAMIIATHGRAIWILDHLEPIQEYAAAQAATTDAKLFAVPNALQWRSKDDQNDEFWGHQFFAGENPPTDAVIQFYLKKEVTKPTLKIADAAGKETARADGAGGAQRRRHSDRVLGHARRAAAGRAGWQRAAAWTWRRWRWRRRDRVVAAVVADRPAIRWACRRQVRIRLIPAAAPVLAAVVAASAAAVAASRVHSCCRALTPCRLLVDGKVVDSKPMKVVIDPANQMTDLQRRRYYDVVMDLHEMQKKGNEVAAALTPMQAQLTEIDSKSASLPPDIKAQFDAVNKEWATVKEKWGVAPPAPPAGGGGGGRGGGPPPNPNDVLARAGTVKGGMMAFYDVPSDSLSKGYTDVKAAMPKAIAETNAWLVKATALSNALKKMNLTLTVPAPIK
jgi:hypothetical protein